MARDLPYGAFNFTVSLGGASPTGGFSDVSGLGTEFLIAEYRNGNDPSNHVRKVVGLHKVADVTLKRGVMSRRDLWDWIDEVRVKGSLAQRDVTITLQDESHNPTYTWTLRKAAPMKWTGPTLAAKAHGDVALEELTLSCEGLELSSVEGA